MKGQELIINFEGNKAYLTEEKVFTLQELNLSNFVKGFPNPTSWRIKVINYIIEEKKIFVDILDYQTGFQSFSNFQLLPNNELNTIEKVAFKNVDTNAVLLNIKGISSTARAPIPPPYRYERPQINSQQPVVANNEPKLETIKERFFIPIKNVHFKAGYVSFENRVAELNRTIEFTVANKHIREEFDAIKNYFGNVLQEKIQFDVIIQLANYQITNIETSSPEIVRIDQALIENVKFEFVKELTTKKFDAELDKQLFTMDELFDTLTNEQVTANLFYENEDALLEDLLQITNTKHYKHLRFLSSKHAFLKMRLRLLIKPFSFIFLIEGETKYHFIWETLNTEEATYIWHKEKDLSKLKLALKRIDSIINEIQTLGKKAYIDKKEENFERIFHDYSESVDGFVKWKKELENVLI
ncbi:MAG: hypothetical protein V4620_09885 [Bacteroidota bacterium]